MRPFLITFCIAVHAWTFARADAPLTYEKDVRPILKAQCFHCHGEGGVLEGELDLRLRRLIVAGGDSGEGLVPGNPSESLLFQRVESGEMPPEDKQLSTKEIQTIRRWIAAGAPTARPEPESIDDPDYITEEERGFWAFQKIQDVDPPNIANSNIRNPIDAFVLGRLQREGLHWSARANAYTLIRRATFDLWGLPPTPEMVDRFVNDDRPSAYQRLIDRLLAAPQYGERWGRHWLDIAGYADSEGYTDDDRPRPFAYFYRDYVIKSFNDDKPFDQFVCEQLAGDEMIDEGGDSTSLSAKRISRLAATGFLRMAPDGTASGNVERETAINQNIADTIEIVSTSLLGLTVGCARCHDHRYDPISQADYYRFRAIFEPALDWKKWRTPPQRRVSLYTEDDKQKRAAVEKRAKQAEAARRKRQQEHIDRTLYEELLVVPDEVRDSLKTAYNTEKTKRTPDQIALLEEYPSVGNITNGSLYLYAQQRARRAADIEKAAEKRKARHIEELKAQYGDVEISDEFFKEKRPDAFAEIQRYRDAAAVCRKQDAKTELAKLQTEINEIRATAPPEHFLRVLNEPGNHTPPTHLFIRGDHNQPGETLPPAELTVLRPQGHEIASNDPSRPTTARRLNYAKHLTSGEHPLLTRVLVNRVWMHHFGRGIVDSPGDFGYLGSRPTHPKLLDWLARRFVRDGWSLKQLHRRIMLSKTYQQISDRTEHLDEVDPDNRLYARMTMRRLESEAIRDAILATSGWLLAQLHGPPVPVKEDAVGQIVLGQEMLDGERKPSGADLDFPGASRRSVYVQVRRSRPLGTLEPFDIPATSPNCTRRSDSNVATQSLMFMNSQFVIDQSEKMAQSLVTSTDDVDEQLTLAWKRCFGREVDNSVLVELLDFMKKQKAAFGARDTNLDATAIHQHALASAVQAMYGANEFLYVD